MKWVRRGMTLLCVLLALCVTAMLLTAGFPWQEHFFAVLAETGVPDLRAAPHAPYYILMYELGGLCIMLLSLLLLLRNGTKTATDTVFQSIVKIKKEDGIWQKRIRY